MAYQEYYGVPGYQEDGQQFAMGETELMYYQNLYEQELQFQQQSLGQEQLPSGDRPVTHRYSITSCKSFVNKPAATTKIIKWRSLGVLLASIC